MISRFLQAIVRSQGNVLIFDEAHNLLEVRRNATILLQTVKGRGSFDTAQANTHLYNTCSVSMLRCDVLSDSTLAPKYREFLHKFGWWTYYLTWAIASTKQLSPAQPWDHFLITTYYNMGLFSFIYWLALFGMLLIGLIQSNKQNSPNSSWCLSGALKSWPVWKCAFKGVSSILGMNILI